MYTQLSKEHEMTSEASTTPPATADMTAAPVARALDHYRLLGRSGLRVSPFALGTMTFGTDWGWGSDQDEARKMFDHYAEQGGNFIDTASMYTNGTAERMVGEFAKDRRDRLVIATKYTMTSDPSDPNAGGNHRKSMMRSVHASLQRLQTDYIDLLYLHTWDFTTPVQEILRGLDDLVSSGKVLYVGISDTPAWQVSRMQAICELRGWAPLIALQLEYNLIERTVERDLIPMATDMGLGVITWSPLRKGVLAGRYTREDLAADTSARSPDGTRRSVVQSRGLLTERDLQIADVVKQVASELDTTPSRVALAWVLAHSPVTAPIIGTRTLTQLEDNLGALGIELTPEQLHRLDQASAIELGFPHDLLSQPRIRGHAFGDTRLVESQA
jgi:aryl-alcohol dehydrogenase-like predicted oxidoreductase